MILSDQQDAALRALTDWWAAAKTPQSDDPFLERPTGRERFFLLDGGAGTGKTTLAHHMAMVLNPPTVGYAAYTAKAAAVMAVKGMTNARTLHSHMYWPRNDPDGKLTWKFHPEQLEELDLLVLDESSMVPDKMVAEITSTGVPTIVLGDLDGQLPPVKGDPGFFEWQPDFRLTEPHRTVLNSPIDRLAWLVRKGGSIGKHHRDGEAIEVKSVLDPTAWDIITDPDNMVICGKNNTRYTVTRRCRAKLGFEGKVPRPGEPVICCRNNYDQGFYNGQLANIWRIVEDRAGLSYFVADLLSEGEMRAHIRISRHLFHCHTDELLRKEKEDMKTLARDMKTLARDMVSFDWAYAITGHKAQGSEWPRVVVIDDQLMHWDKDFRRRWLYTAVTRASSHLTVLQTTR